MIQISEFFENSSFSKILIKDCIISKNKDKGNFDNRYHTLNLDNSIKYTKKKKNIYHESHI